MGRLQSACSCTTRTRAPFAERLAEGEDRLLERGEVGAAHPGRGVPPSGGRERGGVVAEVVDAVGDVVEGGTVLVDEGVEESEAGLPGILADLVEGGHDAGRRGGGGGGAGDRVEEVVTADVEVDRVGGDVGEPGAGLWGSRDVCVSVCVRVFIRKYSIREEGWKLGTQ